MLTILLLGGWESLLNCWMLPIVICWHTTFSTNSFCHVLGTRPHKCHPALACNARNNLLVAIINLGEGWHNNHHANPSLGTPWLLPLVPDRHRLHACFWPGVLGLIWQ